MKLPDNAPERTENHCGALCLCEWPWRAAQLGR
jgi:hypothetical protein